MYLRIPNKLIHSNKDQDIAKLQAILSFILESAQESQTEYKSDLDYFLDFYWQSIDSLEGLRDISIEEALYFLLKGHKDSISFIFNKTNFYRFHKNFRQIDVTEVCGVDSAIHSLLSASFLFWPCAHTYFDIDINEE